MKWKSILFIGIIFLFACKSEEKKKEDLSIKIAQETCEKMSKLSSSIIGGLLSGIFNSITGSNDGLETGNLGKIPDNWCNCYCEIVSKELKEKFSSNELEQIEKDKTLQIILIEKILENKKEELQTCIAQSTNTKLNSYQEFKNKLDEKHN